MNDNEFYQITRLIIYSAIPVLLTLLVERVLIHIVATNKNVRTWAAKQFFLSPNNISRARFIMGVISVFIFHYINEIFAFYWFAIWTISDITDGSLAYHLGKKTSTGEVIDPLSDKLMYFPPLLYASFYLGQLNYYFVLILLAIDASGQFSRSFIKKKSANLFGKTKTFLITVLLISVYSQYIYFGHQIIKINNPLIIGTIILSFCSIIFRVIPHNWYANILSILNFLCGVTSIILIWQGYRLEIAFLLIFLGQVLDLFDGQVAEKWGSTSRGEIFDDIADGTSFGLAIAVIIYTSIQPTYIGLPIAVFYLACTVYRLIRFIKKDKKKQSSSTGVKVFNGLPSPAAALFVGSYSVTYNNFCLLPNCYQNLWIEVLPIIIVTLLMISNIPYIHVGRVLITKIPRIIRVFIYAAMILAVLISVYDYSFKELMLFACITSTSYLVLGTWLTKRLTL